MSQAAARRLCIGARGGAIGRRAAAPQVTWVRRELVKKNVMRTMANAAPAHSQRALRRRGGRGGVVGGGERSEAPAGAAGRGVWGAGAHPTARAAAAPETLRERLE